MSDTFKGGFGSKRDQAPATLSRGNDSYKDMTIKEKAVLDLLQFMLRSDSYGYSNTYNKDGTIKFYGEEKFVVDAEIMARKMIQTWTLTDKELEARFEELHSKDVEEDEEPIS